MTTLSRIALILTQFPATVAFIFCYKLDHVALSSSVSGVLVLI